MKKFKDIIKAIKGEFLYREDIRKFYILLSRYDLKSSNIAVVGDDKAFIKFTTKLCDKYKNKKNIFVKIFEDRIMIIEDDVETTYIHIQSILDLKNYYFRKYLYI